MNKQEIFSEFPVLHTKRLLIRSLNQNDAQAVFNMRTDDRVNRFIQRDPMQSIDEAKQLIDRSMNLFHDKKGIAWVGEHLATGNIIGSCGFNYINFKHKYAEIGGEMSTDFWGKKLAGEAVAAIMNFGFNKLKLHRIEAKVDPHNKSAIALMRMLGFQHEGTLRETLYYKGSFYDCAIYSKIKS